MANPVCMQIVDSVEYLPQTTLDRVRTRRAFHSVVITNDLLQGGSTINNWISVDIELMIESSISKCIGKEKSNEIATPKCRG